MGIAFEIMQGNQRFLMKCVLQAIYKNSQNQCKYIMTMCYNR